ncbi:MAG: DUF58 domain-containing protein [Chitinophagaceae bacterium]
MRHFLRKYIGDLFLTRRFYTLFSILAALFLFRFFIPLLSILPWLFLAAIIGLVGVEYFLLFFSPGGIIMGERICSSRFSNGDENKVSINLTNHYSFTIFTQVIDEIPEQFQKRDLNFHFIIAPGRTDTINYLLRPVKRGEYSFGKVRVYLMTRLGILQRRFIVAEESTVKVYPSFLQLRKYQLMAETNRWSDAGVRRRRQLGHSMEFEQIKEYVPGDDYRTVNWKATARKGNLMVNNYIEEKSQQIYCVIDKGRVMEMPFGGLSLLDYAVNASLVLLNVALNKQDKAGVLTFSDHIGSFLPADKKNSQIQAVLETLYNQKTRYLESDFEKLYVNIRRYITQRSLLVLFTNFETVSGLKRQLPYLQKIAKYHLLVVVFFENTELKQVIKDKPEDVEGIYTQVIAEKFIYEKRLIVKELQQHGILSILTEPESLTVKALNKYLELKARQAI